MVVVRLMLQEQGPKPHDATHILAIVVTCYVAQAQDRVQSPSVK